MRKSNITKPLRNTIGKGLLILHLALLTSCASTCLDGPLRPVPLSTNESEQIDTQLRDLYQSFCYASGEEPDWELMRSVFSEGAQFVGEATPGKAPQPQTIEEFISSWQKVIRERNSPTVETCEQILSTKTSKVGKLIRVDILFQAMKTNDPSPRKPGLDSLIFVKVEGVWKVLSFVVHYESKI